MAQIRSIHDWNKIGFKVYDFIAATAPIRKSCGCVIVIDPTVQNDFASRMHQYDSRYSEGHFPKTLNDFANDLSLYPMPDTERGECPGHTPQGCDNMIDNNNFNSLNPGAYHKQN